MTEEDLGEVLAIERVSFPEPWGWGQFRKELSNPVSHCYTLWVTVDRPGGACERLGGYVIFWLVHGESHILNLVVAPELRGMGLGKRLLSFVLGEMRQRGVVEAVLEVRASNEAAIGLYEGFGFEKLYVRKNYYGDEDAIVMRLNPV
jgi:ribosomal-protein-alanine N-acetyltransferase